MALGAAVSGQAELLRAVPRRVRPRAGPAGGAPVRPQAGRADQVAGDEKTVQAAGEDDPRNIAKRRREGYEFVRADEHPDETYAVHESGKFAGVIGSGDVVLAKIPKDLVDSRNEWVNTRTRNQQRAVDESLLKEQHPSMPINQQRSSDISHGRKKPQFDE